MKRLSPTSWAVLSYPDDSWGSASLHPRLYAIAALRGLKASLRYLDQMFLQFVDETRYEQLEIEASKRQTEKFFGHYPVIVEAQ